MEKNSSKKKGPSKKEERGEKKRGRMVGESETRKEDIRPPLTQIQRLIADSVTIRRWGPS